MFGLLTISRLLFRASPLGPAFSLFRNGLYAADLLFDLALAFQDKELAKKGVNREEEKHHQATYGGAEPFFPFFIDKSFFPEEWKDHLADGNFIWQESEYVQFLQWAKVILSPQKLNMGRDGQWLLKVGRERWEDLKWRKTAFENVATHPEVAEKFKAVQKSPR
jgi:hypothetical protein